MYKNLKINSLSRFYIAISLLCLSLDTTARFVLTNPVKFPHDTTKALVVYGSEYKVSKDQKSLSNILNSKVDRLLAMDTISGGLMKQIAILNNLKYRDERQIEDLIDSLFSLEFPPIELINDVNLYYSMKSPAMLDTTPALLLARHNFIEPDNTRYPANVIYGHWNSAVPFDYPKTISDQDSSVTLLLSDSSSFCGYHHPIRKKEKWKYHAIVTSPYGWREGRMHKGVDLELHHRDPVYSSFSGMVRMSRYYGAFGYMIIVRHFNGLESLYAHLSRLKVKPGDIVEAGQIIGLGGSTGHSTGTHLHYELRFKGLPVNPSHIVDFESKNLQSDVLILKKRKRDYIAYPEGTKFHKVGRGDYLYRIAKRYGKSTNEICQLNGLSKKSRLQVGQLIRITD